MLINRELRNKLDTTWQQGLQLGFDSFFKPASYVASIVSGVAQFCLAQRDVIDGIIITGDIATTGISDDLNVARDFVAAEATAGGFVSVTRFPTLNTSEVPIYAFPGNHDRYENDFGSTNSRIFDTLFKPYMPNFASSVGYWIDEKKGRRVAFVYADFSLQTRFDALDKLVAVYGQGRVYSDILELLKNKTRQIQADGITACVVWAIHFAPFDCGYGLRLIDYDDLVRSAEELGVKAVLCGHTHDASVTMLKGCKIYCGGSAGCIDREHDARIHVINVDADESCSIQRENYLWSASQTAFIFTGTD